MTLVATGKLFYKLVYTPIELFSANVCEAFLIIISQKHCTFLIKDYDIREMSVNFANRLRHSFGNNYNTCLAFALQHKSPSLLSLLA